MAKGAGGIRTWNSINQPKYLIWRVLNDVRERGFSYLAPFSIGDVEKRMANFAREHGIELGSTKVYMSSSSIAHAMRDSKVAKGLQVSDKAMMNFPRKRKTMDLYYNTRTKNFTYTDGKNKFVIHPNYTIKTASGRKKLVNFITASKMASSQEFAMKEYIKVK